MFGRIPLEYHMALDFCLLADFWLLIRFPYCLWVCSNFIFLPVSVLVVYMFLGTCPFLPGYPFYWHIIDHNIFLLVFLFLLCWLWSLLFHSWFYLFGAFPFSFDQTGYWFINFVNSFKEPASGFTDLFYWFLKILIALISALIFIISCLLLVWGLFAGLFPAL